MTPDVQLFDSTFPASVDNHEATGEIVAIKIVKLVLGALFAACVLRMIPECISDVSKSYSLTEALTKAAAAIAATTLFLLISVISFQSALRKR